MFRVQWPVIFHLCRSEWPPNALFSKLHFGPWICKNTSKISSPPIWVLSPKFQIVLKKYSLVFPVPYKSWPGFSISIPTDLIQNHGKYHLFGSMLCLFVSSWCSVFKLRHNLNILFCLNGAQFQWKRTQRKCHCTETFSFFSQTNDPPCLKRQT